jgi:GDP-D-mannose dehydratase
MMKVDNGVKKIVGQEYENKSDYVLKLGNIDSKRDWGDIQKTMFMVCGSYFSKINLIIMS